MRNFNKIYLTCISFLSYSITGALVIVTGMIMGNIAKIFHISISSISHIFTFLNLGILTSIIANGWVINFISIKNQLNLGFILIIIAIIGLIYSKNLILFSISIFILGIVSGITMSIGTYLITHLYHGKKRASLLLITDSFFSISGILFPIITGSFISSNTPWFYTYIIIGIIYTIIFITSIPATFPSNISNQKNTVDINQNKRIIVSIILLSIASTFYILGQMSFISWIPEYIIQTMHANINDSGKLVSFFWMSYMIGMWFFSFILKIFDLQKILLILSGISTILIYFFITINDLYLLDLIIVLLGFFSSAIYTILISLASLQTKITSPRIISLILTSGTLGTLLTFIITSFIVEKYNIHTALILSNFFYGIVFLLSIILNFFTQHRQNY